MDYRNRAASEARLSKLLGKLGMRSLKDLLKRLGDPPDLSKVDDVWWDELTKLYSGELMPELEAIFTDHAAALIEGGVGVDWAVVNQRAADWAREYTFRLVSGINNQRREFLRKTVADFYERGLTLGGLAERLAREFGPIRAEMIAVTETTRAASGAEQAYADELRKQGLELVLRWQTNNDDRVCPICGPRHAKLQGDGWSDPPPAHIRCRCWVNAEPVLRR